MAPVTLTWQSGIASADNPAAMRNTVFAENVAKASGGKITIDVVYADAIIPATEADSGFADGRLDIGQFMPQYQPQKFPLASLLTDLTILRPGGAFTGELIATGALAQSGAELPELSDEYAAAGMVQIVPIVPGNSTVIVCSTPIETISDLTGKQVRVSGSIHNAQVAALGGTPVSLPYAEVYEGLQRGIVDCAVGSASAIASREWVDVAPYVVISEEHSLAGTPEVVAASATTWGELPLAAKQLLFDESMTYVKNEIMIDYTTGIVPLFDRAQSIVYIEGAASKAFDAENEQLASDAADVSAAAAKLVTASQSAMDEWTSLVEDLGYSDEGGYHDFSSWFDPDVDLQPFMDAYFERAMSASRPE
ncbi:TRAP transporter substrate-binding protein DctP [Microbacterium sp. NPDC077644]|uniref:TRAP transporter substrate-binding protein DctP n=1 Tax=Microbacterium sp. NPDC077644 TaxID=3155055 RepID=UPI00344EA1F8